MMTKCYTILFMLFCFGNLYSQDVIDIITTGMENPTGMYIEDNILHISEYKDNGRILRFDLSTPTPSMTTTFQNLYYSYGITVADNKVLIPDPGTGRILEKSLTIPSPPVEILVDGLEAPIAIAVHGNDMYFTHYLWSDSTSQIIKKDLSNLTIPNKILFQGLPYANSLTIGDDDYLYFIGNWQESLFRLDLINPEANIELVASGFLAANFLYYWEEEHKLFVSERNSDSDNDSENGRISCLSLSDVNPIPNIALTDLHAPAGMFIHESNLYFNQYAADKVSKISLDIILDTEEALAANLPQVYPSPARDQITLSDIDFNTPIQIIDLKGRIVKASTANSGEAIDITDLLPGTYYLQVKGRGTVAFIKQ